MTVRGYLALFGIIGMIAIISLLINRNQQKQLLTQKNKRHE